MMYFSIMNDSENLSSIDSFHGVWTGVLSVRFTVDPNCISTLKDQINISKYFSKHIFPHSKLRNDFSCFGSSKFQSFFSFNLIP